MRFLVSVQARARSGALVCSLASVGLLCAGCASGKPDSGGSAPMVPPTSSSTAATHDQLPRTAGPPIQQGETTPSGPDLIARQKLVMERQKTLIRHEMEAGERHLQEGRLEDAQRAFARVLDLDPSHLEARRRHDAIAGVRGDAGKAMVSEARDGLDMARARREQLRYAAREHMRRGHHFRIEADFDRAISEYRTAQMTLDANPMADAGLDAAQVRAAIDLTEKEAARHDREERERRLREVQQIQRGREEAERAKQQRRLERMWREAIALYARGRFEDCERMCERIRDVTGAAPDTIGR